MYTSYNTNKGRNYTLNAASGYAIIDGQRVAADCDVCYLPHGKLNVSTGVMRDKHCLGTINDFVEWDNNWRGEAGWDRSQAGKCCLVIFQLPSGKYYILRNACEADKAQHNIGEWHIFYHQQTGRATSVAKKIAAVPSSDDGLAQAKYIMGRSSAKVGTYK